MPQASRRGRDGAQGKSGLTASPSYLIDDCTSFAARDEDEDAGHDQEEVEQADDTHNYADDASCNEVVRCAVRHLVTRGGGAKGQAAHEKSRYDGQDHEHTAIERHPIRERGQQKDHRNPVQGGQSSPEQAQGLCRL